MYKTIIIILSILILFIIIYLILAGITYAIIYKRNPSRETTSAKLPRSHHYDFRRSDAIKAIQKVLDTPFEEVKTISFDNLTLVGNLYLKDPTKPFILFFHGYRSSVARDVGGGFKMCENEGYNLLAVHERAHGKSGGRSITFGAKEKQDVLAWVKYLNKRFPTSSIALSGISMGASTVLLASEYEMKNVKCILADCGYSSCEKIINKVIDYKHYPKHLTRMLSKTSAVLFARFHMQDADVLQAVKKSKYPILFIHGAIDDFVPCKMSEESFDACNNIKQIEIFPSADHGYSYFMDEERYNKVFLGFIKNNI